MSTLFKIRHERQHTIWDTSEIVIFQLLAFGWAISNQGTAGEHQVGTTLELLFINQEIFLFDTQRDRTSFYVFIKIMTNIGRC